MADIREQLLAAFQVEYREHVDAIRAALKRMAAGEDVQLREVFRRAHSLKGAARAVDLPDIESAAHTMEERFAGSMETGGRLGAGDQQQLNALLDVIERAASAVYGAPRAETASPAQETTSEFVRVDAGQVRKLAGSMHELSANLDL